MNRKFLGYIFLTIVFFSSCREMERNNLFDEGIDMQQCFIKNVNSSFNSGILEIQWQHDYSNLEGYVIENGTLLDTIFIDHFTDSTSNFSIEQTYKIYPFAGKNKAKAYELKLAAYLPLVEIGNVSDISGTRAIVPITIKSNGQATIEEKGFCWAQKKQPTFYDSIKVIKSDDNFAYTFISGLLPDKTYYIRAYAKTNLGVAYSDVKHFTTKKVVKPSIDLISANELTINSAKVFAKINSNGGDSITLRGVCWSKNHLPTIVNDTTLNGSDIGSYYCQLKNLEVNTSYYARAFCENELGVTYSNEMEFKTLSKQLARAVTGEITEITQNSAKVKGSVLFDGYAFIIEKGICWSIHSLPEKTDNNYYAGSDPGSYEAILNGLLPSTKYYVRAYALNELGVSYGAQFEFSTLPIDLGDLTIKEISRINSTSLSVSLTLKINGSSPAEVGVCYGLSANPDLSSNFKAATSISENMNLTINSLAAAETYFIRAYMKTANGVFYSNQLIYSNQK